MEKLQIYAKALDGFSIDATGQNFNCEDIKLGYPDEFSLYLGVDTSNFNLKSYAN